MQYAVRSYYIMTKQRSIRVAMPEPLYQKLKAVAPEHGDVSKLIRDLLLKYIAAQEAS
jgi:metal-responsive CopG/Arc/MetJ family transcriptional regulator